MLSQNGIVEAKNEFEMLSFCESLSCYQKSIEGKIGIITGSGGHGALSGDVCSRSRSFCPESLGATPKCNPGELSPSIQPIAATGNPIDLTGSAVDDDFVVAASVLSDAPEVDCVIVLLLPYLPGITSDLGARFSQVSRRAWASGGLCTACGEISYADRRL